MHNVIVNTTPLIAFSNAGCLDLLRKLYGEIVIPQAVMDEIVREPARTMVSESPWILKRSLSGEYEPGLFRAKLHAGEVEVMLLAKEIGADLVVMDDNAAKKTAKFMGFRVTGSLGVLLRAKREGCIPMVKPILSAMIADGFFIDEKIIRYMLEEAQES
ncbi:MAG: DUF3368 domain-containing protein [Clostridia bacterium]|nr:DUF3368 domain-containing protein [Clostridia bacterium]